MANLALKSECKLTFHILNSKPSSIASHLSHCSDVLQRNGTAVDAAIATLFCDGLINSHSMGIGGGFLMTIYLKDQGKVVTLNARETAPAAASPNMYGGNSSASERGPQSAGVPGEIRGYWEAKQLYGNKNITWKSLLQPSIDMCFNGIPVTWHHASKLNSSKDTILNDPGMRYVDPCSYLS